MLRCHYHLANSESEMILCAELQTVLKATRLFLRNVTKTNPARVELLNQVSLMVESIETSEHCKLDELKHGYLRHVFLNLFDAGDAEMICGTRTYTNEMLTKENWSSGKIPGFSLGGHGGFHYLNSDGQIVFSQATWIS
jgi:hypothetical protein